MIDYSLIINDYSDCVNNFNSCKKTNTYNSCLEIYNNCLDWYLADLEDEATTCSEDLGYCVSACKSDYGK